MDEALMGSGLGGDGGRGEEVGSGNWELGYINRVTEYYY